MAGLQRSPGNLPDSSVDDNEINYGLGTNQVSADDIPVNTSNFDNNLSPADDTVLKAFETLDDMVVGGGTDPLVFPNWTTIGRPGSPELGRAGFNTDTNQFEGWNGNSWIILG